jgi:hypothetical protein
MTLRLTLSAVAGGFFRAVTEGEKPIAKAATAAVREAAEGLHHALDSSLSSATRSCGSLMLFIRYPNSLPLCGSCLVTS